MFVMPAYSPASERRGARENKNKMGKIILIPTISKVLAKTLIFCLLQNNIKSIHSKNGTAENKIS